MKRERYKYLRGLSYITNFIKLGMAKLLCCKKLKKTKETMLVHIDYPFRIQIAAFAGFAIANIFLFAELLLGYHSVKIVD